MRARSLRWSGVRENATEKTLSSASLPGVESRDRWRLLRRRRSARLFFGSSDSSTADNRGLGPLPIEHPYLPLASLQKVVAPTRAGNHYRQPRHGRGSAGFATPDQPRHAGRMATFGIHKAGLEGCSSASPRHPGRDGARPIRIDDHPRQTPERFAAGVTHCVDGR